MCIVCMVRLCICNNINILLCDNFVVGVETVESKVVIDEIQNSKLCYVKYTYVAICHDT